MDGVLPPTVGFGRVKLRTWNPGDAEALTNVLVGSFDHLRPWLPWVRDEPLPREQRIGLFETWERDRLNGGDAYYAITFDDDLVGGCGLHRRIGPAGLEVGYWIRSHMSAEASLRLRRCC
ncbi:MAG: GNAT family N-acetyltransferase [Acidimicrobiales bacterium]|nr:GNAT family N-acetyltransferase [Acidimicrobiales bacterium]